MHHKSLGLIAKWQFYCMATFIISNIILDSIRKKPKPFKHFFFWKRSDVEMCILDQKRTFGFRNIFACSESYLGTQCKKTAIKNCLITKYKCVFTCTCMSSCMHMCTHVPTHTVLWAIQWARAHMFPQRENFYFLLHFHKDFIELPYNYLWVTRKRNIIFCWF